MDKPTENSQPYPRFVFFIIVHEFFERYAYYGARSILMMFLVSSISLEYNPNESHFLWIRCYLWLQFRKIFDKIGKILDDNFYNESEFWIDRNLQFQNCFWQFRFFQVLYELLFINLQTTRIISVRPKIRPTSLKWFIIKDYINYFEQSKASLGKKWTFLGQNWPLWLIAVFYDSFDYNFELEIADKSFECHHFEDFVRKFVTYLSSILKSVQFWLQPWS